LQKVITILLLFTIVLFTAFIAEKYQPDAAPLVYNKDKQEAPEIPVDNPQTVQGVRLGRLLFYDTMLSGNNQQSCGSCHLQTLSFTDGKKFAVGTHGDTLDRNSMSLVNMAWSKEFFWDGRVKSLEDFMQHPISNKKEMSKDSMQLINELKAHQHYPTLFAKAFPNEAISMKTLSKALAQFVRSIVTKGPSLPDSLQPAAFFIYADTVKAEQELKMPTITGTYLRLGQMCTPCHTSESLGGELMANNMIDKNQTELFKVPTLINVLSTAPYMHDGRLKTSKEILQHYDKNIHLLHKANKHLGIDSIPNIFTRFDREHFDDLLQLFTDSSIIKNEAYSNPFRRKDFSWQQLIKD
jgi:cytochrome c peroxidase